MRWTEIGFEQWTQHRAFLSQYLTSLGVNNEFVPQSIPPLEFAEALVKAKNEFEQIRIAAPFGEQVLPLFHKHEASANQIGAVDCIVKRNDGWWPRSALFQAWVDLLNLHGEKLNLDSSVLVVGAGAAARVSVAAVLKLGFKKINISSKYDEEGQVLIREISKKYLGANFDFIGQDKLILLPGIHGMVINTTPYIAENDMLQELTYFNFLQKQGIVWDLTVFPLETPLTSEAQNIGIPVIHGYELAAAADVHWVKWVFGKELDRQDYTQALGNYLRGLKPPMT